MLLAGSFKRLAAATVTILAAAAPASESQGVPPVEQDGYRIDWTAVNWEGGVNIRGGQLDWEASLSGKLSGPVDRQIVGYVVQVNEVLDLEGRSLLPTEFERRWAAPRRPRRENQVQRVLGRRVPRGEGRELGGFTVSLGGGSSPVKKIAKVQGALYVMEVTRSVRLDLPLAGAGASGVWREAEGVRFRVESIEQRGQQTMIYLSHTLGDAAAGGEDLGRPPYLYAAIPLDEQGREAPAQMANLADRGDGQLIINVVSQTGQAARPAAVRLFIAASVEERKIDFELSDLDLGVGPKQEAKEKNGKDR